MNPVLDAMRFAPERDALNQVMTKYGLGPIMVDYEQRGGVRSMRDLVLGTQLKLSAYLSPRRRQDGIDPGQRED